MPLLKGVLKDDTKSDNYRAIALSSHILKVFDNVIIMLFGSALATDSLQFGFKPKTGTTQCSWFVLEVVSFSSKEIKVLNQHCWTAPRHLINDFFLPFWENVLIKESHLFC